MPVMTKLKHGALLDALGERYHALAEALMPRALNSPTEGVSGRGSWAHPEKMTATKATAMDVRLKLADFEAVLKEVKAVAK